MLGPSSSYTGEPNFFDRFDRKEQSGLGGRNKAVLVASPQHDHQLGIYPQQQQQFSNSPIRGMWEPQDGPVYQSPAPMRAMMRDASLESGGGGGPGAALGPRLTEDEVLLLKGIRPQQNMAHNAEIMHQINAASTFHTSAVLDLSHNGQQTVGPSDVDDFFEHVAQLRSSHDVASMPHDVNVYGTPLFATQQRQLEIQRRPSFQTLEPIAQQQRLPPHHQPIRNMPTSSTSGAPPVARGPPQQQQMPSLQPSRRNVDGESIYNIATGPPPSSSSGAKGLSTLEANEIQHQLHSLRRQDAELEAHYAELAPLRLKKEPSLYQPGGGRLLGAHHAPQFLQPTVRTSQEVVAASGTRSPSLSPSRCQMGVVPSPLKGTAGLPANSIIAGGPAGLLDDIFAKYTALAEAERQSLKIHLSPGKGHGKQVANKQHPGRQGGRGGAAASLANIKSGRR